MAKPTYSIGGLDFDTLVKVNAFLNGGASAAATPAAPAAPTPVAPAVPAAPPIPVAAPAAPVMPTPPAPPAPPIPVAAPAAPAMPAPPAPVAPVAAPAAPVATGLPTQADVIKSMSEAVARCGAGGAAKVGAVLAQYNATNPGTPGPITVVAPEQYGNIKAAFEALQP